MSASENNRRLSVTLIGSWGDVMYRKAEQGERALSCLHRFQDRGIRRQVQS